MPSGGAGAASATGAILSPHGQLQIAHMAAVSESGPRSARAERQRRRVKGQRPTEEEYVVEYLKENIAAGREN